MATLYFKIGADYENVIRLRDEIKKLENQLRSFGKNTPEQEIRHTEERLASSRREFVKLTTEAAKAGAVIESDFKKKIYDASQTVNGFTEKIITQKNVVKTVEADVKRLGEAYRIALKNNPISASHKLSEYNSAKRVLDEEKAALFGLTQQQADARLSVRKLRDEYALYKREAGESVDANEKMSISLGKMLGIIGGITALKQIGSEIVRVRGEFQSMQTSIETMVGKDMAGKLIPQIKELAKVSPLTLTDMVNAEKMMLGFNINAEDTIRYLQALSDISMGNSVKFNSLTLAFSQMSAAGKLMGQDLNQMINAGFNPLQVIADKTGKSIATLKNEMSKGAISAEMVQQAFIDVTSAGGKFYQMSENASKTINGQISMMQDALDNASNEIGMASEGVIMNAIQVATSLIENYETVGKVLLGLIATYGTYRGILIATTALEQAKNGTLLTTIKNTKIATAAQAAFNKVVKAHPYALLASVVIGAATAIYSFSERTTKASKASAQLATNIKDETNKLDALFENLKSAKEGTDARKNAIEEINSKYGDYLSNLLTEKSSVDDIALAYENAKKSIIDYNIEKSKNEYLQKPLESLTNSTQDFYETISNFSDELSNDEQKGRFKAYIDQIVDSVRKGGYFDIDQIYDAFRAAQSKQTYKTVDDWLEAFRGGKEEFGMSNTDIIKQVGGLDVNNVAGAGKVLESSVESLKKAKSEFEDFANSYKEVLEQKSEVPSSVSTIDKEIEDAALKIKTITQEIADLRSGKLQAEAGKTVESAIEAKNKELQAAQKSLEILTGEKQRSETKELSNQQKIADELLDLRRKNQQAEIDLMEEGTEKKIAQIKLDYEKEREAIKRQAKEWANKQGGTLTAEQSARISVAYSNADKKRNVGISNVNAEQSLLDWQAMNDYLKEYGTFQKKRLAITEEYNRKIDEASTKGERLSLQRQLKDALEELNMAEFKDSINFADVFGNLDEQTTSALESLRGKLSEYINRAAKDLKPEDLKELQDAFNDITFEITDRKPFEGLKEGLDEYKSAQNSLSQAQEDLNRVLSKGEVITGLYEDENGRLVKRLLTLEQAERNVAKAQNSRQKAMVKINQSLNKIGEDGRSVVEASNAFTGMLSDLGINISEDTYQSLEGVGQIFEGVANLDLTKPGSIITSSMSIIGGIGKAIGGLFGGKSKAERDSERLEKVSNRIAETNEVINSLIEKRIDLIKEATAAEREGLAESSRDIIERQRQMMEMEFQGLLGNELLGKKGKNNDLDVRDLGISSIEDLAEFLTSDRLVELMEDGYGITDKDKWMQIVDEWEALNEQASQLDDTIKEINTGITFDEARDGLDDFLLSADTTFKDISDNFEEYMRQSVLKMVKSNYLNKEMESWYNQFSNATSDGVLSDDEVDKLRRDYENIYQNAQNKVDQMINAAGLSLESSESTQQDATSRGFGTEMTHEDAGELSGRFTAVYESNLGIKAENERQTIAITELSGSLSELKLAYDRQGNIAEETLTILANSYLELQQISENTGEIIKPIKQMQADISEIKRNLK